MSITLSLLIFCLLYAVEISFMLLVLRRMGGRFAFRMAAAWYGVAISIWLQVARLSLSLWLGQDYGQGYLLKIAAIGYLLQIISPLPFILYIVRGVRNNNL